MSSLTPEAIYSAMEQALEGPEGALLKKKFKACVVFDMDDGTHVWRLDAKSGTLDKAGATSSSGGEADLTVKTSLDVLRDLLNKKLTPQQAFLKGKLKIKGQMGLAMKLTVVLAATRKHLPSQSKL